MNTESETIDSEVAAMLLGTSKNNLRQLVYRKQLVPRGRQKRKNSFFRADVLALQAKRNAKGTIA